MSVRWFVCIFILNGVLPSIGTAQDKVISWATNPNYPPYDWSVGNSDYAGACIDVLKLVLPDGYVLKPVVVPWARAQVMAEDGDIDLLVNIRKTPERSRWLEFSKNPTFPNPIAVFMRKDKMVALKTWDELKPLKGGVTIGDAFGGGFDEYLKDKLAVEAIPQALGNLKKLEGGRIDYFVTGYYTGMALVYGAGMQDRIVALKHFISDQPIYLGFSKHSEHLGLLAEIDRKLAQLGRDGVLDRILEDHLEQTKCPPIASSCR